ncbi:MAG: hypothetical protein AAFQ71_07260 [Planctomycetota bacterium]
MATKKRKKNTGGGVPWGPVARAGGVVLAVVVGVVGVSAGVMLLRGQAEAALERRVTRVVESGEPRVVFDWPRLGGTGEIWMDRVYRERLVALCSGALDAVPAGGAGAGPLSRAPLERVVEAARRSGWFVTEGGAPVTARRLASGQVKVEGDWRRHFAQVRRGATMHLISDRGMAMDARFNPQEVALPVIAGARFEPAAPAAQPTDRYLSVWPGADVAAGLELLLFLRSEDPSVFGEILAVDVGDAIERGGRAGRLILLTEGNSRIVWGAPVGRFAPGQQDAETKLDWLRAFRAQYGRIDGGRGSIDLTGPVPEELDRMNGILP